MMLDLRHLRSGWQQVIEVAFPPRWVFPLPQPYYLGVIEHHFQPTP